MSYFVYNVRGRKLQTWEKGRIVREVPIDEIRLQYCRNMNYSDWRTVQHMGQLVHQQRVYVRDCESGYWQITSYLDVSSGKLFDLDIPSQGCLVENDRLIIE